MQTDTNPPTEKAYCRLCGSRLKQYVTNRFDEYTGYAIMGKTCPNLKCEDGCAWAGHDFGFFTHRCKRCGYVIFYY